MEAGLRKTREEDISVILLKNGAGSTLGSSTFVAGGALPWDHEKSISKTLAQEIVVQQDLFRWK